MIHECSHITLIPYIDLGGWLGVPSVERKEQTLIVQESCNLP